MSSIKYRPEIDGLRALAVLPVILFHSGATWLPGGFVGVDVFFVISGYLITSIILQEHGTNTFTLRNFWLRRVRRIMPAMLLMLLVALVAGRFILFGGSWAFLGWQGLSTLMLSANMMVWHLTHDYWGVAAGNLPLLHNWSLAVEEQFYLIYPLLILACLKGSPQRLLSVLVAIFIFSLTLCLITSIRNASIAFYFLPTRAWELAGGGFLAALENRSIHRGAESPVHFGPTNVLALHRWLALLGLALIGLSWFVVKDAHFPGYQAVLPVVGAMLVIQFAGEGNCPTGLLLSSAPLRFIGKISYSLYLWHWPAIVLGRLAQVRWEKIPTWSYLVLIPFTSILAYYLVEKPGRRWPRILPPVFAGAGAVTLLSAGLIVFKPSYDLSKLAPTVWMGSVYDAAPEPAKLTGSLKAKFEGITRPEREPQYAQAYQQGIIKHYGGETVEVLVLGNSHALMWAPVIDEICKELHLTVCFYAADGVDPIPSIPAQKKAVSTFSPEQWFVFDANRVNFIKDWRPRVVILASRWSYFSFTDRVDHFLGLVCDQNSKLLLIDDPPELAVGSISVPEFVAETSAKTVKALNPRAAQEMTARLASLSERFKCVQLLPTAGLYETGHDRVRVIEAQSVLYMDGDHLSLAGARLAKERIKNKLGELLQHE